METREIGYDNTRSSRSLVANKNTGPSSHSATTTDLPAPSVSNVPHFNLRKLHDLLMQTDEYRGQREAGRGLLLPADDPPKHPTVLDVMTTHFPLQINPMRRIDRGGGRRDSLAVQILTRRIGGESERDVEAD